MLDCFVVSMISMCLKTDRNNVVTAYVNKNGIFVEKYYMGTK